MNRFRVRVSSLAAALCASAAAVCAVPAPAQERLPALWFQGTRLILEHPVALDGDIAVALHDAGLRRFLERLGATVSFEPQSRYVVITAEDRRTIVFTLGDTAYTAGGTRAQAPFAPFADAGDAVLPLFALARALYVEPVADGGETVLQPRIGALDVRSEGSRTTVTVRGAMPLVTAARAETPERVQLTFVGLGSAIVPDRRAAGPSVAAVELTAGGSARVPTSTLTVSGVRGATHRVVPTGSPDSFEVVFDSAAAAVAGGGPPTPPPLGGPAAAPTDSPTAPVVTDLAIEPGANDALSVRVALSAPASYSWRRLADHRWYLDLAGAALSGPGRSESPAFGGVQSVRVAQIAGPAVRVAFTLGGEQRVDVTPTASGLTITVAAQESADVARSGAGRTGLTGAPAGAPAGPAVTPAPAETPWKFTAGSGSRTIVLDPGHGGGDTGAMHNGLVEKNLTMDIAQRLRSLLVAQGWTVRMTRESDVDPVSSANVAKMRADGKPNPDDRAYLQTRCDTANDINARMFISIHINSSPSATPRGTTVYWYKPQDAPLAQALERSIVPAAGTVDDGTRHENFYVVRHTTMPAVLIETAFMTNPGDVTLLRSPSFLQSVAQGIANGVKAYANSPAANSVSAGE